MFYNIQDTSEIRGFNFLHKYKKLFSSSNYKTLEWFFSGNIPGNFEWAELLVLSNKLKSLWTTLKIMQNYYSN